MCKRVSKCICCEVESMCGHSLKEGVLFVAIASLVISIVVLLTAIACLITLASIKKEYNTKPVVAVTLVFGLVASSLSIYQIIIALLLLWQAVKTEGNIFLCALWYVSHMSLLTIYFLLFSAEAVVCFFERYIITGVMTTFIGIMYQGMLIYCIAALTGIKGNDLAYLTLR